MMRIPKQLSVSLSVLFIFGLWVGINSVISDSAVGPGVSFDAQVAIAAETEEPSPTPVVLPSETRSAVETDGSSSGWYSFEDSNALADVRLIAISIEFDTDEEGKIVPYAGVFTRFFEIGDSGYIEAAWVKMDEENVSFRTNTINGFEFEFVGEFFKKKRMGEEGEKLLRGTLTQYRKGKNVAQTSGDLAYYEPQCWH